MSARKRESPEGSESGGRGTGTRDITIQVEEADGDTRRRTRFADEQPDETPKEAKVRSLYYLFVHIFVYEMSA